MMKSYFVSLPGLDTAEVEAEYAIINNRVLEFRSNNEGLVAAFNEWAYFKEESRVDV